MKTLKAKTSHLKIEEVNQKLALEYIAKNHIAKDGKLVKAINKLNCYVLHTLNEEYFLRGNEKDLYGNIFEWTNRGERGYGTSKSNRWFAAFEGTNIVGVQMLRWVQAAGLAWTGFLHAKNKETILKNGLKDVQIQKFNEVLRNPDDYEDITVKTVKDNLKFHKQYLENKKKEKENE